MLGIVMPVWLTDKQELWDSTVRALLSCTDDMKADRKVIVVPNRLHRMGERELQDYLETRLIHEVTVLPWDGARSVAGAWNQGMAHAGDLGCDRFLLTANDCYWKPGAIDEMLCYGDSPESRNVLAWSGYGYRGGVELTEPTEGCDCTGFMIRSETIDRIGWFDQYFRPAYFEDNDYCTRIVLSGATCKVVPSARFHHEGSLTIRTDPEAAHHVGHWFEKNRERFIAKWGCEPPKSDAECLAKCFRHPWNDSALPLSFCGRE